MAGFSFNPLNVTKRSSRTQYTEHPAQKHTRRRNIDEEKQDYSDYSDDGSDYSSDASSLPSSRDTSASYGSGRPMLRRASRKPSAGSQRPSAYKVPNKVVRYLCCALISTILLFMVGLVRMSVVSSRKIEMGDVKRPPPPPPTWESFTFLSRYYGGIRTLVSPEDNTPEYPTLDDELTTSVNESLAPAPIPIREVPASEPFLAYENHTTTAYLSAYPPVQECFLDAQSKIRLPYLQYYQGRPTGFPDNVMGSYDLLGLSENICFERYGRLGPYGFGYSLRNGGLGVGQHGDQEGAESVWNHGSSVNRVDYTNMDWADAQKRCYIANSARFEPKSRAVVPLQTFSVINAPSENRNNVNTESHKPANSTHAATKFIPRTAVVIRVWDDFKYEEEAILHLRAMISELSLGSGGEYDVHLLVHIKDDGKHPIWADPDTYEQHLNASVPKEFRGIATLWSETQMLMLYQGMEESFARGPGLPVHGVYRGLQMAMQVFAQKHQEYDFFWHWEMDIRYTGHYYDLFSKIGTWTTQQPRKGLWERNSRFYVPSVHGTWEDFKQMVRVQTEMGTASPNNIWSGLNGAKKGTDRPKADEPIWGPERPRDEADWFEIEKDPVPPTPYDKDKYVWGVGEGADIITFNPLFDPDGTSWGLEKDITGYNKTDGLPPRRASIVTASRMSRRILDTMHRETTFRKHHAFSEMWGPTTALHHGYKAVYVPHPMFVDREWPTEFLASVMNAGRNGATGGARTSVFGDREHNLLGMTWYYNAGFAPNLWKRWLGLKVDNEGGEEFETTVNEGRSGKGVINMKGGEGRMCLPPMLLHPVKTVDLPVEEVLEDGGVPESDPSA